jgi:hypothetical protein
LSLSFLECELFERQGMDIIEQNATSRFLWRHVETFSESVSWMNRRCGRENIACGKLAMWSKIGELHGHLRLCFRPAANGCNTGSRRLLTTAPGRQFKGHQGQLVIWKLRLNSERHGIRQSSQVREPFVTVLILLASFSDFSAKVILLVQTSRVSGVSSPQQLAKLSLFYPGLVSLSVRAVSAQSDGLWIGRAGFREPPTLFYAEARFWPGSVLPALLNSISIYFCNLQLLTAVPWDRSWASPARREWWHFRSCDIWTALTERWYLRLPEHVLQGHWKVAGARLAATFFRCHFEPVPARA